MHPSLSIHLGPGGAFDPFAECVPLAHERGAWVHVDGAFGLWGAVSPRWREAVRGVATRGLRTAHGHPVRTCPSSAPPIASSIWS